MSVVVSIHQPNFLPWLGFFHKWFMSDVFIILDNVQFPKTGGGVWTNRTGILVGGARRWLTVPIDRSPSGTQLISEVRPIDYETWAPKMLTTFHHAYSRAPFYEEARSMLETTLASQPKALMDLNMFAIDRISREIGLKSKELIYSSSLGAKSKGTEMLIELVKAVGGTAYLSGNGAQGYQEEEKFDLSGIKFSLQAFSHPIYSQINSPDFVPGLSILDTIANIGFNGIKEFLFDTKS